MPHTPDRVDPVRSDFVAAGEYELARQLVRSHDHRPATVESAPPLRNRCAGPGCGMSKSAFRSTEEFDQHRQLCEARS